MFTLFGHAWDAVRVLAIDGACLTVSFFAALWMRETFLAAFQVLRGTDSNCSPIDKRNV
ncbi:hypothetical protein [Pseudomonas marginalis]|nr:hypothetical protein [Pseudomonas marginalis]